MDVSPEELILRISNEKRKIIVKSLIESPRNDNIIFSQRAFFYIDRNNNNRHHLLRGLLPVLRQVFWPNVNMKRILAICRSTGGGGGGGGGGQFIGTIRGSLVS